MDSRNNIIRIAAGEKRKLRIENKTVTTCPVVSLLMCVLGSDLGILLTTVE